MRTNFMSGDGTILFLHMEKDLRLSARAASNAPGLPYLMGVADYSLAPCPVLNLQMAI